MSSLKVTTTGSHPPRFKASRASIREALKAQIKAHVHVLVDGQVRSDIVGIFAKQIGLKGKGLPYEVNTKIGKLEESVTLPDLRIAAQYASGHVLKAHITGPTIIAENSHIDDTLVIYEGDAGFKSLVLDIAQALADEARFIAAESDSLMIKYLQIDEPSLVFGADLEIAQQGLQIIVTAWKEAGGGPTILHVCGDYGYIFLELLKMPVDILNIEIEHLWDLTDEEINILKSSEKKISFGVIPVNASYVPSPQRVAREVLYAGDRCGMDLVWGITPVCGMRLSHPKLVRDRMEALTEAVNILDGEKDQLVEVSSE